MKERWDHQLRKSIHAAAYWLNPGFQYDQNNFCQKPEVMVGLLEVIESKITGANKTELLDEPGIFCDREKGFGRELALANSKTTCPGMHPFDNLI